MRLLFAALGCICFVLGSIGIFLPILPTVPLYMAAVFFLARSSVTLHDKFVNSKLYKRHLEGFVQEKTLTRKSKITVMVSVTAVMAIGFAAMNESAVGRICLVAVWVFHVIYFVFRIKTADGPRGEC